MNDDLLELTHTGTSWDEVTADNVLLHTFEQVHFAADSCFVEDLGGLLEGSGRHEGLGTEGSTGDTLEDLFSGSRLSVARLNEFLIAAAERRVLIVETTCGNDLSLMEELGVTGIGNDLASPDTIVLLR